MSDTREFDVVTGAFGYTGRYITRLLLESGRNIRTLTNHADNPNGFRGRVEIAPLNFQDHAGLVRSLRGALVLYNTYWVRFNYGGATFEQAVTNSRALIRAAVDAGVRRIVHLSIANPSLHSNLPYYSGKAQVETAVTESRVSYAILRPTVVFGGEDILINNIAWLLRHFPVFAIPGTGRYGLQPMFVEDLAELAVRSAGLNTNLICDAVGPEVFAFEDLVRTIATGLNVKPMMFHVSPDTAYQFVRLLGPILGDVILTREEIDGLMANLLVSNRPPTGSTRFTEWLAKNAGDLGTTYSSELQRHYR